MALDIAQKDVRSLFRRPFMIFSLRVGQHLELLKLIKRLKLIKMLEVVQIETRCCLPLLIDMKVHQHLSKMMLGQSYKQWDVEQLLLSHSLVYGVWHPYKYVVTTVPATIQIGLTGSHTGFKVSNYVYM